MGPKADADGAHRRTRTTSARPRAATAHAGVQEERPQPRDQEEKSRFLHARRTLSEAVESHDVHGLQKAIPIAAAAGVSGKEIDAAKRVLDFEVNKSMVEEVNGVRRTLESLAEVVEQIESRAAKIEGQASLLIGTANSTKSSAAAVVSEPSKNSTEAWLTDIVEKIEQRIWEALEKRVEEQITKAVDKAVKTIENRKPSPNLLKTDDSSNSKAVIEMSPANTAPGLLATMGEERSAALTARRPSRGANPVRLRPSLDQADLKDKVAELSKAEPSPKKRKPVEATQLKTITRATEENMQKVLSGDGSAIDDSLANLIQNMPSMLKEPQNWGVRVKDVTKFYQHIREDLLSYVQKEQELGEDFAENLHVVTPRFIKPWTQAFSPNPLAAVINADNLCANKFSSLEEIMTAQVFISHCWNENFGDFVTTLTRMLEPDDVVWICAISICQNVDIASILGDRIEDSPFWKAMPHCRRVAMLIDHKAEPFERAWCALEEYLATYKLRLPFSICMPDSMDEEAWNEVDLKLQNFSIRDCKASEENDRRKIMEIIADKADIIDRVVRHESENACFAARVMRVAVSGTADDLKPLAFNALSKVTDGAGRSIVHVLAQHGCVDMLNMLMEDKLPLDLRDTGGKSPMHLAVTSGHDKFLDCLICNRADINLKDQQSSTPLNTAAHKGKAACAQRLITAGANIDFEDNDGFAPLLSASVMGHVEVVQLLLDQRANMCAKDNYGHCALTVASQSGKDEVVKCLIANGLPLDEKDVDGCTALMYASGFGQKEVVRALLDGRADTNVTDNENYTALSFAQDEHNEEIVELLASVNTSVPDP